MNPSISAGKLKSIDITPNIVISNLPIFSTVEYKFTISLKNPIPNNGYIEVEFPDNVLYHDSSSNLKVKNGANIYSASTSAKYSTNTHFNFLKKLIVKGICDPSGCNPANNVEFTIYDNLYSSYST